MRMNGDDGEAKEVEKLIEKLWEKMPQINQVKFLPKRSTYYKQQSINVHKHTLF